MFEQNTSSIGLKCKGCSIHCKLSCTTENKQYYPIIGNETLYSYLDENGIEVPLYASICNSAIDALNLGMQLSTICDNYNHRFVTLQNLKAKIQTLRLPLFKKQQKQETPQGFSQERSAPAIVCQGCKKFCTIDAETDQYNNYYPTIDNKLIDNYINPLTGIQEHIIISKCTSEQEAHNLCQKISKLCKHHHKTKMGLIK